MKNPVCAALIALTLFTPFANADAGRTVETEYLEPMGSVLRPHVHGAVGIEPATCDSLGEDWPYCFDVMPGESTMTVTIDDVTGLDAAFLANFAFETAPSQAVAVCGTMTIEIPAGALRVWFEDNAALSPSNLESPCKVPATRGSITVTFE